MDKLLEIETILSSAAAAGETPLSLAELKRRMEAESVRHQTVKDCLNVLEYFGRVKQSDVGVEYVPATLVAAEWVRLA